MDKKFEHTKNQFWAMDKIVISDHLEHYQKFVDSLKSKNVYELKSELLENHDVREREMKGCGNGKNGNMLKSDWFELLIHFNASKYNCRNTKIIIYHKAQVQKVLWVNLFQYEPHIKQATITDKK